MLFGEERSGEHLSKAFSMNNVIELVIGMRLKSATTPRESGF